MVSPYVGIIQIRLWVWASQPTLSLLLQAPLLIAINLTHIPRNCKRLFARASAARYPVNDRRASASGSSAPGKLTDMICFFPLFAVY